MDVDGDGDIDVDLVVDIYAHTDEWSLGAWGLLSMHLTTKLLLGGLESPSLIAWPSAEVLRIGTFMHVY